MSDVHRMCMACGLPVEFMGTGLCTSCGLPGDGLWRKTRWRCGATRTAWGTTVHMVGRSPCGTTVSERLERVGQLQVTDSHIYKDRCCGRFWMQQRTKKGGLGHA